MSSQDLDGSLVVSRVNLSKDTILFLLNFIAGYGYLLSIITYYFEDETVCWSSVMRLGLNNKDAQWYGNLAGDFAWTVEPLLVIMSVPIVRSYVSRRTDGALYNAAAAGKKKTN